MLGASVGWIYRIGGFIFDLQYYGFLTGIPKNFKHMESHWNARSAYFNCLEVENFILSKVEIPCRVPHCLSLTLIRQCTLSKQCNTDTNPTCAIWENIVDSMGFTPFGSLKILLCEFYGLEIRMIIRMTRFGSKNSKSFDCTCIFINFISCYYSYYIYLKNFTGKTYFYYALHGLYYMVDII